MSRSKSRSQGLHVIYDIDGALALVHGLIVACGSSRQLAGAVWRPPPSTPRTRLQGRRSRRADVAMFRAVLFPRAGAASSFVHGAHVLLLMPVRGCHVPLTFV